MRMKKLVCSLIAAGCLTPMIASATNGYFSHGYGLKGKGRAGVSTAFTDDTFGGANNPAQMVWVGQRLDAGIDWFRPIREASRVGSNNFGTGNFDFSEESENNDFLIPEFGYNMMISPTLSLGVTVYGNGGMNTTYESGASLFGGGCRALGGANPANPLCGIGSLGVNLSQLIIAPTLAWKFTEKHSVGISPLFGYQRFKSYGLQPFAAISSYPPSVLTNPGTDDAWGVGVRVGWLGKFTDTVSVGAAYSSKIYMDEFDKYRGLFAGQGDFDIPANLNVGVKWDVLPALTVGFDYQRIWYNDVDSVGNPSNPPGCIPSTFATGTGFGPGVGFACLGASDDSIGFGWQDIDIYKLGVEYQVNEKWRVRAGYSHTDQPIESRDVTFNILAPGVIEDHVTLGFTYALDQASEVTVSYMHGFENSVSSTPVPVTLPGLGTVPANNPYFPAGGIETITMHQDSLGIAYSRKW